RLQFPGAGLFKWWLRGSGGAGNPGGQGRLRRSANLDVGHFTAFEDGERRDRADAELRGEFRIFVDVQLRDLHLAGEFVRDFLKAWTDHLARAAPLCPEIHNDGFGGVQNFSLEIAVVDFHGSHGALLGKYWGKIRL